MAVCVTRSGALVEAIGVVRRGSGVNSFQNDSVPARKHAVSGWSDAIS
jgi:hypothetical protein